MADAGQTEDELIEQFEQASLEPFHHADHVRVAFAYLRRYPVLTALEKFSVALQRFAAARGKPQLYHQTITWAYVFLIRERMARAGVEQRWEDFSRDNADLLAWKGGILQRYYREETLASELAKRTFLFPDRG